MSTIITNKHSTNSSAPAATGLTAGELAICTLSGSEKLYTKNSAGTVVNLLDWSKVGTKPTTLSGFGITDGATSSHTHTFASLTSKPTTLGGYGITDAATSTHIHTNYLASTGGTISGTIGVTGNLNVTGQAIFNDQFYTKKNIMMQSTSASGDNTIFSNDQPINIIKYDASYNTKSGVKLTDTGINVTGNLTTTGAITTSDYLYTSGNKGWYNSSNAAGLTSDSYGVVRGWNTSKFKIYNTDSDSIYTLGGITAQGEITAYSASDKRLKKNIKPIDNGLDIIKQLNPVTYNWNSIAKELNPQKNDNTDFGLIAQEVETVIPGIVHQIYGHYKSIDYVKLIPYLISAIKEQQEQINELKNNK